MRFTLKDYQVGAVADVLRNLADARDDWHGKQRRVAFSLTATTGAGKTVMAAAAIEALFEGNADFDFEADPTAAVLWFTDDPALNQQTRARLMEASDRLTSGRLIVIENDFQQEKLEAGKVYFLNAQKLSKNAKLVKGAQGTGEQLSTLGGSQIELAGAAPPPDLRQFTFWDILRHTIEDEQLTLYVILDEAHRGMKPRTKADRTERQTTVKRLVNGALGTPAVPIVWGISATVERFDRAMESAEDRTKLPAVLVDPALVQESGLLKDDVRLDFPAEAGRFDTVLLKRATKKVVDATALWQEYASAQDPPPEPVVPLLVVQMPNKPTAELLRLAVDTVFDAWPDLPRDGIAHVFGEHTDLEVGDLTIPHISPERVQDERRIRVLLAKDAISTGWDCPRAEVLVSFRPAKDQTHITQLLGRMVRTPLARRVPGNDLLNSVECMLPHFNRKTATDVAEVLLGKGENGDDSTGGTGGGNGRRVLIAPADMVVNAAIPRTYVWEAFDLLPSQTLPRKAAKPVRRLMALAQALSRDALRQGAGKDAYKELIGVLDGIGARFKEELEAEADAILEVEGETIVASRGSAETPEPEQFLEIADDRSVEADFKAAGRVLSAGLTRQYADHIAVETEDDDGLFEAHVKVAAIAKIEEVQGELDRAANELAREWIAKYRVGIKSLADDRRTEYDRIIAMSREPQRIEVFRPRVRAESTEDADGNKLPTRAGHLMSGDNGEFPVGALNDWELAVLDAETERKGFLAWYRNPSRASEDSLAIAYTDGNDNWRRMCPDFIFFHGTRQKVHASIVDPHGFHLSDALAKLRGLANYSEQYGDEFHRIESVAKTKDGILRVLDLKVASVRDAIRDTDDAEAVYLSDAANDYL